MSETETVICCIIVSNPAGGTRPRGWQKRVNDHIRSLAKMAALQPDLTDPVVVHANMLRGAIAKPTLDQIIHLYGVDALCRALVPVISREAALDEMARLGQEFDAALKGETP